MREVYIDSIDNTLEKMGQDKLPYRNKLNILNKMRVNSRHHSLTPNKGECDSVFLAAEQFLNETAKKILHNDFWLISFIGLIEDGVIKQLLQHAENQLQHSEYKDCLITCRKVVFLEIEKYYDISEFETDKQLGMLAGAFCKAPAYTRNNECIKKYVNDPTGYIVIDDNELSRELLEYNVDKLIFQNIIHLTPSIYISPEADPLNKHNWIVKHIKDVSNDAQTRENAIYVFNELINIVLNIHHRRKLTKHAQNHWFNLKLKGKKQRPIYKKFTLNGEPIGFIPRDQKQVTADFNIADSTGKILAWHIMLLKSGSLTTTLETAIFGYISAEHVDSQI